VPNHSCRSEQNQFHLSASVPGRPAASGQCMRSDSDALGFCSLSIRKRMTVNLQAAGLGTLGTFEGSVARSLARKLRRISKELTATNQKVGSSNL